MYTAAVNVAPRTANPSWTWPVFKKFNQNLIKNLTKNLIEKFKQGLMKF